MSVSEREDRGSPPRKRVRRPHEFQCETLATPVPDFGEESETEDTLWPREEQYMSGYPKWYFNSLESARNNLSVPTYNKLRYGPTVLWTEGSPCIYQNCAVGKTFSTKERYFRHLWEVHCPLKPYIQCPVNQGRAAQCRSIQERRCQLYRHLEWHHRDGNHSKNSGLAWEARIEVRKNTGWMQRSSLAEADMRVVNAAARVRASAASGIQEISQERGLEQATEDVRDTPSFANQGSAPPEARPTMVGIEGAIRDAKRLVSSLEALKPAAQRVLEAADREAALRRENAALRQEIARLRARPETSSVGVQVSVEPSQRDLVREISDMKNLLQQQISQLSAQHFSPSAFMANTPEPSSTLPESPLAGLATPDNEDRTLDMMTISPLVTPKISISFE